ncbi:protein phosphatase 1 regulatory subunit 3A isoform X2 [Physeter macrocephalus]|uniref:Protein phosphatase 1 regulatory subunit 3A isoform X2 n=1 Tax=Physeter macrocephalus TaxID=9755 RepID=A0A455BA32_PHYMC|nr:protein phosphatase 1 regulatory subunit 3A isoform X2 [Physeter catodon]|eukprot:XP_028345647.1 protein phosphatase 1 regulatory subunit 3A isoform X2 [Physeter catodon]
MFYLHYLTCLLQKKTLCNNFKYRKQYWNQLSIFLDLQKEQELEPGKLQEEVPNRQIKGCLKVKSSKEESLVTSDENNSENSKITDTYIPTIVFSHEDKEDLETSNQNVKDVNTEHDERNEKELDLMINQHLIRSTASRDEKNTVNFPNKAEGLQKKQIHDEVYTDLFKRPLSSSSSAERSLKGEFYHNEKYSSGNKYSYQPSEEITSDMGEIKPSLGNTSSDELVQVHIGSKEVLDNNANPAQGRGRVQISCPSADQLMADNLNQKLEGEAKKTEVKDWECLRSDFRSDFHSEESIEKGSSKKAYGNGKNEEEEQRICLGVNEKHSKNFQSILHDQERKMSHSEISVEGMGASNRDLTALPSKDTPIHDQSIRADTFHSPRTNLSWEEAVLTTSDLDLSASEGTILGGMPGQACLPRNRNVLRNEYLFQVEEEKSAWINPEDQNKNTQHKQSWNVLESQGRARESKTNIREQTKGQADCGDMWEKRDNTRSLKANPTEELFTCQETASCELSSLADHGITEKAEAGTAYIIKTTSESTLESMSAREKAIIAKLPQETARSDRPIEVKETAFDPHEGRNDDSHDTLCQRDTVGVICDNDFEKESCLGICNVHVDEMEKEETISIYNPGKTHDRKKCVIGNTTSVEESSQVITDYQKAASKLDLHLGMLPTDKKIFPENRDHGQIQELSKKTNIDAIIHSALNSDTNRASQNGSHISNHRVKTSLTSHEQATAIKNAITTMTLQSISSKSKYNCNPTSEIQGAENHHHPASTPEEVSKSSRIVTSGSRRERCIGQIVQQGECSVDKSPGPTILISEAFENMEEARNEKEGLINSGQSLCSSGDKESESPASDSLPAQESQAQRESLLSKYTNSKIPYFLLFLIFLVTIYQYDLMTGLAFYVFSLYWLCWEGGRQKESVKKK